MHKRIHRRLLTGALVLGTLAVSGCDLDIQDPNRPTEEEVFGSPEGIQQVAVGMQALYAEELRDPIWVNALVADEMGVGRNVFASYLDLDAGNAITRGFFNTAPFDPWTGQYRVIKLANDLLRVTPNDPVLSAGTKSGILALARLHKAMALGNLVQLYERVALDVGPDQSPTLENRERVLQEILSLLEEARAGLQATPPSALFNTQVVATGFNLSNTIDAMIARYALIAGRNDVAIQAATRVSPTTLSTFNFSAADPNPLWELWYNSGAAYQMRPERSFRTGADEGDRRVAYWVRADTLTGPVVPLDDLNRYRDRTDAIPAYLPDEMKLIRAEAHARLGQLPQARQLVNEVRTQCASPVAEPVACLPARTDDQLATQGAILDEILRQRRYELFLQGVRVEDLRRFGKALKYPWMPIPQSECDRNPNAGCT